MMENIDREAIIQEANAYILPQTLEFYLEKGMIIEYLHSFDNDSLEYAMDFIEADEITEKRKLILLLIKKEFNNRIKYPKTSIQTYIGKFIKSGKRTLTIFLASHKLTDYLQTLSDEELHDAETNLYMDDIVGDAENILDAIRTEKEYRQQQLTVAPKKTK